MRNEMWFDSDHNIMIFGYVDDLVYEVADKHGVEVKYHHVVTKHLRPEARLDVMRDISERVGIPISVVVDGRVCTHRNRFMLYDNYIDDLLECGISENATVSVVSAMSGVLDMCTLGEAKMRARAHIAESSMSMSEFEFNQFGYMILDGDNLVYHGYRAVANGLHCAGKTVFKGRRVQKIVVRYINDVADSVKLSLDIGDKNHNMGGELVSAQEMVSQLADIGVNGGLRVAVKIHGVAIVETTLAAASEIVRSLT